MPRILVAEDERPMCRLYEHILGSAGLDVAIAFDGQEALEKLHVFRPDLLIVDLRMPRMDGWLLTRAVREDRDLGGIPILVVSAVEEEVRSYQSVLCGADDFIAKPVRPVELVERIRWLLERQSLRIHRRFPERLMVPPFAFEARAMRATCCGKQLDLLKSEFMVLAVLMIEYPGTVSNESLLERALGYPPGAGHERSIRTTIAGLRKKLGDDGENPQIIITDVSRGYRLFVPREAG